MYKKIEIYKFVYKYKHILNNYEKIKGYKLKIYSFQHYKSPYNL